MKLVWNVQFFPTVRKEWAGGGGYDIHRTFIPLQSTVVAKSFENDTNINFHLSLYDGNLHILQNVMKICHANELNPQKTFPLHFSPATKGPADFMSVILSLTQVC